jgi:hypothetical protein
LNEQSESPDSEAQKEAKNKERQAKERLMLEKECRQMENDFLRADLLVNLLMEVRDGLENPNLVEDLLCLVAERQLQMAKLVNSDGAEGHQTSEEAKA